MVLKSASPRVAWKWRELLQLNTLGCLVKEVEAIALKYGAKLAKANTGLASQEGGPKAKLGGLLLGRIS